MILVTHKNLHFYSGIYSRVILKSKIKTDCNHAIWRILARVIWNNSGNPLSLPTFILNQIIARIVYVLLT